jgi:chemotaxis protein methyltransferase CheR/two-component system CheB/CheR fusion protein
LGTSETVGNQTDLFIRSDLKSQLYTRTDKPRSTQLINLPSTTFPLKSPDRESNENVCETSIPGTNLQNQADQFLLRNIAPPAVLVTPEGDILYINGRTGKYLEPAAGKANWNIHVMAREGLRHPLGMALKQAQSQAPESVQLQGLPLENGKSKKAVNIRVEAITHPEALRGMLMVTFEEIPQTRKSRKTPNPAEQALSEQLSQQNLILREEMQTKQEALNATIEELQSTNEELQSANEELTTAKEEMQSLNEELQTVNAELQTRLDDLSQVNNDMNNLLESTEIATIFLDNKMHVRRFTTPCTRLFKLISADIGRPLSDIVTELDYPTLHEDAVEVLRSLIYQEKQVTTHDQRWFRVRIMPYRTQDNLIDGVVITFMDISESKRLETELRKIPHDE